MFGYADSVGAGGGQRHAYFFREFADVHADEWGTGNAALDDQGCLQTRTVVPRYALHSDSHRLVGTTSEGKAVDVGPSLGGTRVVAESRLLAQIDAHGPVDLLVLAGFMRNLTPYFIDRFNADPGNPRIMNIHPAILPSFPGVDGYGDTFRYGCKVGGCTVHFIDYGEDSGPIIGQRAFPILDTDSLDDVKRKGLEQEWQLYPECIQHFAQGSLKTVNMTHTLDSGNLYHRTVVKVAQTA